MKCGPVPLSEILATRNIAGGRAPLLARNYLTQGSRIEADARDAMRRIAAALRRMAGLRAEKARVMEKEQARRAPAPLAVPLPELVGEAFVVVGHLRQHVVSTSREEA